MATDPNKMLNMSDEDIMAMTGPPVEEAEPAVVVTPDPSGSGEAPAVVTPVVEPVSSPVDPLPGDKTDDEPELVPVPGSQPVEPVAPKIEDGEAVKPNEEKPGEKSTESKPAGDKTPAEGEKPVGEPRVFQVPTSFKANGKTIELKDEGEALALMQMGANYTRKLQDIQPHRKVLTMLENNGLLDEGKLSFLIDLEKKDPEAIKKLLKDAAIDPLEIDATSEPAYVPGNHRVTDDEVNFRTTLDDLASNQAGAETLAEINGNWDQASKDILWSSPEVMTIINEQRSAGVYDVIKAEVERQTTLGRIPPNTPFLEAYKSVGDAMAKAALPNGQKEKPVGAIEPGQAQPLVLATRAATPPQSKVANSDKVSAASSTRSTPTTAKPMVNPLAESDEAFMKRMENRL